MKYIYRKYPQMVREKGNPTMCSDSLVSLSCMICIKVFQPVHSEGDQSRVFFGRNDAEAETLVLWPPHVKSWLTGKDSDAGRDWGQEEKGTTEEEMAGWHHWLDGRESGWTLGLGDGQGGLVCCDSWGHKESDTTERLNWTELNFHTNLEFQVPFTKLYSSHMCRMVFLNIMGTCRATILQ